MSFDLTRLRLQSAPIRLQQFIIQNLETWIKETVVAEILNNSGRYRKFYEEHITIDRLGDFKAVVILDWQKETKYGEKPIGIFIDQGTKEHDILPRGPWPLHWIETVAAAKFMPQFNKVVGYIDYHVFRWKVHHPGTKAVKAMERGARKGLPLLKKRIIIETNQFLERSKMR